jgi:hypothetical protein
MKRYWVIGGIYTDTNFNQILDGGKEERIGPFPDYDAAKTAWQKRAWETVDHANARFRIEEEGAEMCFWVVGGPYCDTSFSEPAAGGGEEWHGPFDSYETAKVEWSRQSWSNVDDAMCRYRIEKLAQGEHPQGMHPNTGHANLGAAPKGKSDKAATSKSATGQR